MAIALRGAAVTPTGNPSTGFSVTIPSAVVAGDVGFITVTSRDNLNPLLGPTISDNDTGGNAWAVLLQSLDGKATTWWKRATSGTASKSVTIASAVGSCSGVMKWFSGVDAGATPYTNAVEESNASGDESHAGFTPGTGSMCCAAVFNYNNDNSVTNLSFATIGLTTATEKTSNAGNDCANIFGHAPLSSASTGTLTWSQTDGVTYSHVWAIKPLVTYSITASGGSYSLAGTAASLEYGRVLAAGGGTYALAGTDATLTYDQGGYTLAVDPGAYDLAGIAASLEYGRVLAAVSGVYALAGTDAALEHDREIAADVGAYALAGSDAALEYSRLLTAAVGAYDIAGVDATLSLGKVLAAGAGAIVLSGQDAALLIARRAEVDAGAYTLAGQDATMRIGKLLAADAGAYTLAGQDVTFLLNQLLAAASGAYSLAGTAAALRAAHHIVIDSGAYSVAGTDAVLLAARKLVAASGAYVIVGQPVTPPSGDGDNKRAIWMAHLAAIDATWFRL